MAYLGVGLDEQSESALLGGVRTRGREGEGADDDEAFLGR